MSEEKTEQAATEKAENVVNVEAVEGAQPAEQPAVSIENTATTGSVTAAEATETVETTESGESPETVDGTEAADVAENADEADGADKKGKKKKEPKPPKEKKQKEPKVYQGYVPKKPNIFTKRTTRIYFYIALGALGISLLCMILVLVPHVEGYSLIPALVLQAGSLIMLAIQRKKNNFKAVGYVTFVAVIIIFACLLLFLGWQGYSAIHGY